MQRATYRIIGADASSPAILLRTIDRDPTALSKRHGEEIARITDSITPKAGSLLDLDAADAYEWSLYHLLSERRRHQKRHVPDHLLPGYRERWASQG